MSSNKLIYVSNSKLKGFGDVWNELLKYKVAILYKISLKQNQDFNSLLNQFLPEALKFKNIWEDDYILKDKKSSSTDSPNKITFKKPYKVKIVKSL